MPETIYTIRLHKPVGTKAPPIRTCNAKMATNMKKKRYLTLKQKVEVIKTFAKNSGICHRSLDEQFGCGRTQIGKILRDRVSIMSQYQSNASENSKVSRVSEFEQVNKALYEWYVLASSKISTQEDQSL